MCETIERVMFLGIVSLAGVMACGGGGRADGGGGGGPSLTIAKAGAPNGDNQTAVVGATLAESLRVIVQEDGTPKAGVTVSWSAQGTGAAVSPGTSQTDANGRAATLLTLGTVAGGQTGRATLTGATGSPLTFNATATVGPAFAFTVTGGDNQYAVLSTNFTTPLAVKLADQYGNGIAGVTVTWATQSGSVTLAGGATSVTDGQGVATKSIAAGATLGAAIVRATNPSVAGNLDFALTVTDAPVEVTFGNTFFQSAGNGTTDPAVDTTVVGRPVRWTGTGGTHTVQSTGTPTFNGSGQLVGSQSYTVIFTAPGTYQYNCNFHGNDMTGRVVVLP